MAAALVAIGLLGYQAPAAAADTIYTIGLGNAALTGCCSGPYATATVHWVDSDDATVTFSSLVNGGYTFVMGGSNVVDVNVNAGSWTASALAETRSLGAFFTPGPASNSGSGNVSEFGLFNQTFKNFDGFKHSATNITFGLHNSSGTWASSANVLAANALGHTVAIHGFACAVPGCSSVAITGFATDTTLAIPEPETYAMLLAGLGLMGFVARRRSKKTS